MTAGGLERSMEAIGVDASDASTFCKDVVRRLNEAGVEFLVGGGLAWAKYSGVDRPTKDLDIFVRPIDVCPTLALLAAAGYDTALPFPHWLGKVRRGSYVIDVIFSSGNGLARVDDLWFLHSVPTKIANIPIRWCPPEEMIWSKAFVQERERFDGADVLHLFRALGPTLDWTRLLQRFDKHWRVLLSCIVLFGYVYPADRDRVPPWVCDELLQRLSEERTDRSTKVCQGTLLSRSQYQWDIKRLGYIDARIAPVGSVRRADIAIWDAAIDETPRNGGTTR